MKFSELLSLRPTVSFHGSRNLVLELMYRRDMRCYSSKTTAEAESLVARYLKHHARMPGLVSNEVYAERPIEVFFWVDDDGSRYKGGLFSNGAVMSSHPKDGDDVISLFINDAQAGMWLYPGKDHYVILADEILDSEVEDDKGA